MKDITREEEIEYRVLSHLVQHSKCAKHLVDLIALEESRFSSEPRQTAYRALVCDPDTDHIARLAKAAKILPELADDAFLDRFLHLAPSSSTIKNDFIDFIDRSFMRELKRSMTDLINRNLSPDIMMASMAEVQKEIGESLESAKSRIVTAALPLDEPPPDDAQSATAKDPDVPQYVADETLLSVPGFIDEFVEFTMRTAPRPNRVLAFASALAFLAHLAGRKFVGPCDSYPNIYAIALASSGVGKEHPRKVMRECASRVGMMPSLVQGIASGQAIEDALLRMPALLCLLDEFDSVLREMKNDRTSSSATESLGRTLLTIFSASGSHYSTRIRAAGSNNRSPGGEVIDNPSFSIFATAIPSNFYGALSQRALTGGLLGRCVVFEATERGAMNYNSGIAGRELPYLLAARIEQLAALPPRITDRESPPPRAVDYASPEVREAVEKINAEADGFWTEDDDEMEKSLWTRSGEHVLKFALLYAISQSVSNPTITLEGVNWAWRLVKAIQERMIQMVHDYAAADEREQKILAVLRIIRKAGEKGVMRSSVAKKLRLQKYDMDMIEASLEDREEIVVEHPPSANGKGTRYRIVKKGGAKKGKRQ